MSGSATSRRRTRRTLGSLPRGSRVEHIYGGIVGPWFSREVLSPMREGSRLEGLCLQTILDFVCCHQFINSISQGNPIEPSPFKIRILLTPTLRTVQSPSIRPAKGFLRLFVRWPAMSPSGTSTFPIFLRDPIPIMGNEELFSDSLGTMRCCHVDLESKGHPIVTDWAIHESI
jgi:hypothetical protein